MVDAISRKWSEAKGLGESNDGADWSVCPDWEASQGITNDIMQLRGATDTNVHAQLHEQFADDPWLNEVVEVLTNQDMPDIRTRRRARHRATNFMIEGDRLWQVQMKATDRVAKVECAPRTERARLAAEAHEENGHFGWDHMRLKLREKWFWPRMDRDSKTAVTECPHCRNFSPKYINLLLQPI